MGSGEETRWDPSQAEQWFMEARGRGFPLVLEDPAQRLALPPGSLLTLTLSEPSGLLN